MKWAEPTTPAATMKSLIFQILDGSGEAHRPSCMAARRSDEPPMKIFRRRSIVSFRKGDGGTYFRLMSCGIEACYRSDRELATARYMPQVDMPAQGATVHPPAARTLQFFRPTMLEAARSFPPRGAVEFILARSGRTARPSADRTDESSGCHVTQTTAPARVVHPTPQPPRAVA